MVDEPFPDEIKIVMIKGTIPNFITARATIAGLQAKENSRAEASGDTPRKIIYCQFCGKHQQSMQGMRAHLKHCRGKRAYQQAVTDGVTFHVARESFTVAARSIKLLTGLEKYEGLLNKKVQEDGGKAKVAILGFNSLIHGAKLAEPEGWVRLVTREVVDGERTRSGSARTPANPYTTTEPAGDAHATPDT